MVRERSTQLHCDRGPLAGAEGAAGRPQRQVDRPCGYDDPPGRDLSGELRLQSDHAAVAVKASASAAGGMDSRPRRRPDHWATDVRRGSGAGRPRSPQPVLRSAALGRAQAASRARRAAVLQACRSRKGHSALDHVQAALRIAAGGLSPDWLHPPSATGPSGQDLERARGDCRASPCVCEVRLRDGLGPQVRPTCAWSRLLPAHVR